MEVSKASELRELVMDREAQHAAIRGAAKSRTRLSNWTELNQCVTENEGGSIQSDSRIWKLYGAQ